MIHWDTINLYLKMWCITKINPASIYVHMAMTIIKLNLVTHMTHYTVTLNLKLTNTKAANDWHCCKAIIHFFLTDGVTLAGQVATVQCCHSLTQSVTLRCSSIDDSCREATIPLELWILGMSVRESLINNTAFFCNNKPRANDDNHGHWIKSFNHNESLDLGPKSMLSQPVRFQIAEEPNVYGWSDQPQTLRLAWTGL